MNKNITGLKISDINPNTVLIFDAKDAKNATGGSENINIEKFDGKGANIVFVDGNIKFITAEELMSLRWEEGVK